jgi:class 3 adenylate cyclase/tetratricopeptide (TPR) repeat protein
MEITCPGCEFVNLPGETFCGGCGEALAAPDSTERREIEPQRRQLTVMFCDLVGSTALSQQLDPEDLRDVIRSYQKHATHSIASYDGFIARFMGDGIMAYFGYPHAHEDDPARAIRAGLDLVESMPAHLVPSGSKGRVQVGVRVGVATGLVVVGDLIGSEASEEAAVVGNTPNLAARLQGLTKPNTVAVSPLTKQLAGAAFEYADQGAHRLKGFARPLHIWRVMRASDIESRFDAARRRRLTPLIGREAEISMLGERWQRSKANAGQMVLLSGESGIGKSRISEALVEHISGQRHLRLSFQCSPYHSSTALYPFIHQIERAAEFKASDSGETKLRKLIALLEKWSANMEEMVPLLTALLSLPSSERYPPLPMSPDQQKQKTLSGLLDRLRDLSAQAPVLVIFEDLQWIDPTSRELLDRLATFVAKLRVLVIVTSRPIPQPAWVDLPHAGLLSVERLSRTQAAQMVRRILGRRILPAALLDQIVARADGVPLYLEELTAMVARTRRAGRRSPAADAGEIPSTLQDSLMARLDQLGSAKEVAQTASVIGREFLTDLLAAIAPNGQTGLRETLKNLESSSIIYDCGLPPGSSFAFRHALLQDAAYASLLRTRRQELHGRIAETLESAYPERVRVEPELVAHHYARAGRFLLASKYQAAAGRRAIDRAANLEARAHADQGLSLLAQVAQNVERDKMELGLEILRGTACRAINGFASTEVEHSFGHALNLCKRLEDERARIDVLRGLFSCYYARGALVRAREQAAEVAALGERLSDSSSTMLGQWMLGCVAFWQGDYPTARRELERAYAQYDPAEQRAKTLALQIDPGVNALFHLSCTLWIMGYPDQALRTGDEAIRIARQLGQPFALAMALFFACRTRACTGHDEWVQRHIEELIALTSKYEFGYLRSCARVLEGQARLGENDAEACLDQIRRAFGEFRTLEAGVGLTWARSITAAAYVRLGKAAEGLAIVDEALAAADRNGEYHWDSELWRLKGDILLLPPRRADADAAACFQRAMEIARRQEAKSLELRAALSLGRLLERQGETESARRTLEGAYRWFTEGSDTIDIRESKTALERWQAFAGKDPQAAKEATDASQR